MECLGCIVNSVEFQVLLGFVLFDIITGTLLSFKQHKVMSKVNKNGITRHFTLIMFVVFIAIVFTMLKIENYFNLMVYFYIVSYGLSIFENLGGLGVPFPKWIQEKFIFLKEELDNGVEPTSKK